MTERLAMPRLSAYGITTADLPAIARAAGNKNNPAALTTEEKLMILTNCY